MNKPQNKNAYQTFEMKVVAPNKPKGEPVAAKTVKEKDMRAKG